MLPAGKNEIIVRLMDLVENSEDGLQLPEMSDEEDEIVSIGKIDSRHACVPACIPACVPACDSVDGWDEQFLSSLEKEFSHPERPDRHPNDERQHQIADNGYIDARDEVDRVMDLYLKPIHKESKDRPGGSFTEQLHTQIEHLGVDSKDQFRLELTLDMRSREIPDVLAFSEDVEADLCSALRLHRRQVLVNAVRAGSVIVDITIKRLGRVQSEVCNSNTSRA